MSEHILHASVLSMVEFDDDIYAAGHCFDWNQHMAKRGLFCPFAHRLQPPELGAAIVKDLATEYPYLGNTSEFFFQARKNAEKVIAKNEQYLRGKCMMHNYIQKYRAGVHRICLFCFFTYLPQLNTITLLAQVIERSGSGIVKTQVTCKEDAHTHTVVTTQVRPLGYS